jgi:hypothetical protein
MADLLQWEYTIQTFGTVWRSPKDEELQAVLNTLGEQGWEVFSLEQLENSNKVRLAAKRPLPTPVRRRSSWPG